MNHFKLKLIVVLAFKSKKKNVTFTNDFKTSTFVQEIV